MGGKPGIALILAQRMRESEGKAKPKDAAPTGELAAAEEALAAVRAGDAEGFAAALKSFVSLCKADDYETPED